MESYKHSCPFCGQHIEYTEGYCGKQMVCPTCGQTVTFPAIPPGGRRKPLHLKRAETSDGKSFDFHAILAMLRKYKHWNVILSCLVPFIIIGALLAGAAVVRKQFGNDAPAPVAAPIQADPNAWQKMTDLARAEQSVQAEVRAVNTARAALASAEQRRDVLHAFYHGKQAANQAIYNGVMAQYKAADQAIADAHSAYASANQRFNAAIQKYQQLGGTVDYRRQLAQ
jgi:hypothetical protein